MAGSSPLGTVLQIGATGDVERRTVGEFVERWAGRRGDRARGGG